ncbi:hypothetical protein A5764_07850 [Mycobacterium sp. 852002-51057_SCH5723018]|nr:hypothetical protein A5764_07850 [Mycobacterium sp. 852002-51057_SCH5723018]
MDAEPSVIRSTAQLLESVVNQFYRKLVFFVLPLVRFRWPLEDHNRCETAFVEHISSFAHIRVGGG